MQAELALKEDVPAPLASTPAGQAMEEATGLAPELFVEGAIQRAGVILEAEEEYAALATQLATRLETMFVSEPGFAEWLALQDDPRPALCTLVRRWTREPSAGLRCAEGACETCLHRQVCPNAGMARTNADGEGTYKVFVPSRRAQGGSLRAVSYPCSGEPLYDFNGAKRVIEFFAERKPGRDPGLAPWAVGATQKFDHGCLRFGIADPSRK
jgi:hypothetical protein